MIQRKPNEKNMKPVDTAALHSFAAPVLAGLGYDCVDVEWKHENGSWVMRVFVDFPERAEGSGGAVSHEDCARVSRALSAELDVADLVHVPYTLEVSSPGLNRPLRAEGDFRRFVGRTARIRTRHPIDDNRRNFHGRLVAAAAGRVRIAVDGREFEIPVDDVEKANLEFEFPQPDRSGAR